MFQKILVPLDGSKLAGKILPPVEELVKFSGAEVHLRRVVMTYDIDPKEDKEHLQKLSGEAQEYLDQVAPGLKKSGIQVSATVAYGKDAVQICDYASEKKFNLIAMSTHGRSGLGAGRWAASPTKSCIAPACRSCYSGSQNHNEAARLKFLGSSRMNADILGTLRGTSGRLRNP